MAIKKKQFSITEAALRLNISRQAVDSAIQRGVLKARARTKKVTETVWYISEQSLEAYRATH
jgi:DNA-directed RNA polymerase specialized sigma24 family protein